MARTRLRFMPAGSFGRTSRASVPTLFRIVEVRRSAEYKPAIVAGSVRSYSVHLKTGKGADALLVSVRMLEEAAP